MGFMTAAKWTMCALFLFAACSSPPPPQTRAAEALLNRFGQQAEKKHAIRLIGSGGSMPSSVEQLEILFTSDQSASIDEARHLQQTLLKELSLAINSDETLRPFLKEFPFPTKRISVSVSYERDSSDTVAMTFQTTDQIFYYTYDPTQKKLKLLFSESSL